MSFAYLDRSEDTMSKNVLVLTGSPRDGGNSEMMADAFIKGALAAGHDACKFRTATRGINGCRACNRCFSKGHACAYDDDFNELAPLLEDADVLVLCTPLYWFSFPMQIKAAIDKMYAFHVGKRKTKIKGSMLMVCGEDDDIASFDAIVRTYELIAGYEKWTDLGRLIVPGVNKKGDIERTDALKKAEEMGRSLE